MIENNEKICRSCSKEPTDRINIMRVIAKLEEHFATNDLPGAVSLLRYWEREARDCGDRRGLLSILDEELGLYRRTADEKSALCAIKDAFALIQELSLQNTLSGATIYLNGATTLKAFGKAEEAMPYYQQAQRVYEETLPPDDFHMAALYNNMASACADLGRVEEAEGYYCSAIEILSEKQGNNGEIAVSMVNLAHLYHDGNPLDERVELMLDKAWEFLLPERNEQNGNYAFVCSKCAPSYGYFGHFVRQQELNARAEALYGRS